jgi:SAM-dependent methyltransferase
MRKGVTTSQGRVAFSEKKYTGGKERRQPFKQYMLDIAGRGPKGEILDIGCGTGLNSKQLHRAGYTVTGIDLSPSAINQYMKSDFSGAVVDIEQGLPFAPASFDSVWISEVIEHIVEYKTLLSEISRVLKPGGRVYLTTPNSAFWAYRLLSLLGRAPSEQQHPYHVRFFSYRMLEAALATAGFQVSHSLGQNVYLIFPAFVIRTIDRLPHFIRLTIYRALQAIAMHRVPGLIHGDKLIAYRFGLRGRRIWSSCIMVIATKLS